MKRYILTIAVLLIVIVDNYASVSGGGADFVSVSPQGSQTVYSVVQDDSGMMWVGTENGLYQYDGYNFYPCFSHGDVANTRVHALLLHGRILYLGTDNGLLLYSFDKGTYKNPGGKSLGEVRALCLSDGDVLCGSAVGLFKYNVQHNKLSKFPYRIRNIYSLLKQRETVYVGTLNGLYEVNNSSYSLVPICHGRQPLVNALLSDGRSSVLVGTEGDLFSMKNDKRLESVMALKGNSIKALSICRNKIFVGTDNGLYALGDKNNITHMTHDSRNAGSIANNIVWALFGDNYGNLWAGTDNGLSLSKNGAFSHIVSLGNFTGLGDGNCLYSMLKEPDGTLWMGGSNGLIHYTPRQKDIWQGGRLEWFRQNNRNFHLSHNRVRSIYRDRQGDILICTDHGINLYDRQTGQLRNFIVTDRAGKYTTSWAYDIVQDTQNRYWISAYMGGVFMIDKQRLLESNGYVIADKHFAAELQSVHVGRIAMDSRGFLWLQLNENGLDRIDTHRFIVESVVKKNEDNISYVMSDTDGNIWTSGMSNVTMYSADGHKVKTFKLQDYPSRRISAMAAIGKDVWAVAGQECIVFSYDGTCKRFASPGGLTPLSVAYDDVNKTAILGGNDVMAVLSANSSDSTIESGLVLSAIMVNGNLWHDENIPAVINSGLELKSTQNNLTLKFSDLPYTRLRQAVYIYKLDGADHTWQYFQDGSLDVTYNALPYGRYTLKVCEVDGKGCPSTEVFTLKVHVLPPWYLSLWAKMFYIIIVCGLFFWCTKFYIMRKRLADERKARRQVIEQSIQRATFYSMLSRRLKAPISKIMVQTGRLLHDEIDAHSAIGVEGIRRQSAELSRLVYLTLDQTGSESVGQGEKPVCETVDIVDFCRRTVMDVCKDINASKQDIEFRTDTPIIYLSLDISGFYPPFYTFIKRGLLLSKGKCTLSLSVSLQNNEEFVVLTLAVPSYVIMKERQPFVFYRYYRQENSVDTDTSDVNELSVLRDMAVNNGGSFDMSSDESNGTVFMLELPCGNLSSMQGSIRKHTLTADVSGDSGRMVAQAVTSDLTDGGLLTSITAIIEAHMSDSDFTVSKLASDVGIGDKSLYRRIKQLTGKTPVELIRNIRMQKASLLLREGKFSVSEVMYLVGFQNSSYFSKCFVKSYGMTPAEYSKKASL